MAFTTAVLSWCVGRYLRPAWLRWLVFAWTLALLDFLTIAACLGGQVRSELGYVLVSAQISLLALWAILGPGTWQLRLPCVAAIAPLVIIFSGSLARTRYTSMPWNMMMLLTFAVAALLCGGLRCLGFSLQPWQETSPIANEAGNKRTYQFGMKHMLVWLTVTGPLLLFVRSLEFHGETVFPTLLVAVSVATVNLIAIWAVLGGGYWIVRLASLLSVPYLLAWGLSAYSDYLQTAGGRVEYRSVAYALTNMKDTWTTWLGLDAALLAALLLFFRAGGSQLVRTVKG